MRLFEILTPSRLLYHGTSLAGAIGILRTGYIEANTSADASFIPNIKPFVSLTRNSKYRYSGRGREQSPHMRGMVQFVFDSYSLVTNHKLAPINYNNAIARGTVFNDQGRHDTQEERTNKRIPVELATKIQLFVPNRGSDQRKDEFDHTGAYPISTFQIIERLAKQRNIPVEYVVSDVIDAQLSNRSDWVNDEHDPIIQPE